MKLTKTFLLIGILAMAGACGDDDDDSSMDTSTDTTTDGGSDSTSDSSDSSGPSYQATAAVINGSLAYTGAGVIGNNGLTISLSVDDSTNPRVPDVPPGGTDTATNFCSTTVYKTGMGDLPSAPVDVGNFTITIGTGTPITCSHSSVLMRYWCPGDNGATTGQWTASATDGMTGAVTITETGAFTTSWEGQWVTLSGTTVAGLDGSWPVVSVPDADTMVIVGPVTAGGDTAAAATYQLSYGEGPHPGITTAAFGDADAIKFSNTMLGLTDVTVDPGNTFDLAPDKPDMTDVFNGQTPGLATDIEVECDTGECTDTLPTLLTVSLVSTNATTTGATDMPVETTDTNGEWVVTSCTNLGTTRAISAAHVEKHISMGGGSLARTRSRISVSRFGTDLVLATSATNPQRLLAGFGHLGFSTPISAKPQQ